MTKIHRDLTIIIPCFNEENAVSDTIDRVIKCMHGLDYELVVVNDGSTDNSGTVVHRISQQYDRVSLITLEKNHGYGFAIKYGAAETSSNYIAIVDADGTYPIEKIPDLYRLADDMDMVVGSRTGDNVEYSKLRSVPKFFMMGFIRWITRFPVPDFNSGLRIFRRKSFIKFVNVLPDGFSLTTTITVAMHTNFLNVHYEPISYSIRIGKSKIKPIRDTLNFFKLIIRTGMFFAPLRVLSPIIYLSLVAASFSLIRDVFYLKNLGDMTVVLFFFFFNTLLFGYMGEMIARLNRN